MKTLILKIVVQDNSELQNVSAHIGRFLKNEGKDWMLYQWDSRDSYLAEVEFYEENK